MYKVIKLIFSALLLVLLVGCSKENSSIEVQTEPQIEVDPIQIQREAQDKDLSEINTIFANLFNVAISEATKATFLQAANATANSSCPMVTELLSGNGNTVLGLELDFGTGCTLASGIEIAGTLTINTPFGTIENTSEDDLGLIEFENVVINGCSIEPSAAGEPIKFRFFNSSNTPTLASYDFFANSFPPYNVTNVTTGTTATYTPQIFFPDNSLVPILRVTTELNLALDINDLIAAEYELEFLPIETSPSLFIPNWQVVTSGGMVYRLITGENDGILLSPSCNAIMDGVLQLRSAIGSYPVLRTYDYGVDASGTSPATALCDNWVELCYYDENENPSSCTLAECFSVN